MLNSRYGVDLGLVSCVAATTNSRREAYRVDDIVESICPDVVTRLFLGLCRAELGRTPIERHMLSGTSARARRAWNQIRGIE